MEGSGISECPVSFIADRSLELLTFFLRTKRVHESCGAAPYSPGEWPAWAVDVMAELETEEAKLLKAHHDALRSEAGLRE